MTTRDGQAPTAREPTLPDVLTAVVAGQWTQPGDTAAVRAVQDPASELPIAQFEESSPRVAQALTVNAEMLAGGRRAGPSGRRTRWRTDMAR